MSKYKRFFFILLTLILFIRPQGAAGNQDSGYLKPYCGSAVLKRSFSNLNLKSPETNRVLEDLNAIAAQNKGFNSLYEIKIAAEKAGLETTAIKLGIADLRLLSGKGQMIANIYGNRHFCLIKEVTDDSVSAYIPGINYPDVTLSNWQFTEYWNNVILIVSDKTIDLSGSGTNFALVSDNQLKDILGAQACANCSGGSGGYSGPKGSGRWSEGNSSGKSRSGSSSARRDASTKEPVIIRNGNLYLEVDDISVPTRGMPLSLTRYYNSEIVSEVTGWIPEPCAGSWVIENGEYSGQGNRVTSDIKLADFTLELDMQTIQPGIESAWETGWINIRYTEDPADPRKAKDCYYFLMHTDGKIELAKWKNGTQYWLYNKATSYRPTNKNRIKIEAYGANIKVYINGSLQINYTDSNPVLAEGRIALESYFSHSHFDNVKATSGSNVYSYNFDTDDNEFIFGYGWTNSYSLKIRDYGTHLTLTRENNSREIYVPQADGTYKSVPVNYYSKLTKDAGGYSLKTKYGIHYRFDTQGRLQYIEDRNLNRTTLEYGSVNGKTLLISVTEPAGRKIAITYGANSMVSAATDPQGNSLKYYYDGGNRLTSVADENGNVTAYAYDGVTNNPTQLTDPEGNKYKYYYSYNDRVSYQTDPLGQNTTFDFLWTTVHVINKRGEIYKYNYDGNGFVQSIADPKNVMERTVNDANGNITEFYDKNGNKTSFTYDAEGNKTSVYDAKGNYTRFTYNTSFNLPTSSTDARGNVTNFSYDSRGNLTQATNPEGGVTRYEYNSYGQVTTATDANGNITRFSYDSYGNLITKIDAQNNVTTYSSIRSDG